MEQIIYVGSYNAPFELERMSEYAERREGITIYEFKEETGELIKIRSLEEPMNASFLASSMSVEGSIKSRYLYVANEFNAVDGKNCGKITTYKIAKDGNLTKVDERETLGGGPCHLCVTPEMDALAIANYAGGTMNYCILKDGLPEQVMNFTYAGSGINKDRQEAPHVHSVVVNDQMLWVVDLGLDTIKGYKIETGKINQNPEFIYKGEDGLGPRSLVFHPNGKYAYVTNELDSSVSILSLNEDQTNLNLIETIPTIPDDWQQDNYPGSVLLSGDGNSLYVSNRGYNSIAVFEVNQENGNLKFLQQAKTKGEFPRSISFDGSENWMFAGNQNSNTITLFKRNQESGLLEYHHQVEQHIPVCIYAYKK